MKETQISREPVPASRGLTRIGTNPESHFCRRFAQICADPDEQNQISREFTRIHTNPDSDLAKYQILSTKYSRDPDSPAVRDVSHRSTTDSDRVTENTAIP